MDSLINLKNFGVNCVHMQLLRGMSVFVFPTSSCMFKLAGGSSDTLVDMHLNFHYKLSHGVGTVRSSFLSHVYQQFS